MTQIRINSLPAASPALSTDVIAIDGTTTRKATLTEAVNAGRPFASQAEAEAGTSATKGMSPLTTAQAIAALGGAAFAPIAGAIPTGGTVNQVLGKTSGADYAMSWRNAGAGDLLSVNNLADVANAATALSNLGGQPLDADLTAIAALSTQTYGRSLLTLASSTALSGELSSFYQPLDADLTSWASVTRAAGFDTFASGPTSANLKALMTDETGSGALVFATSPTLVTPTIGAASGTSLNLSGLTASSAVATDASKNLVSVTNTGSGNNVLATSPTLVTPALGTPSSGVMTNVTGLPLTTGVTGTLPIGNGGTNATDVSTARLNFTIPVYVSSISALQALDTTKDVVAELTQSGRAGIFVWTTGNFSSQITADTQQGVYVKANAIASTAGAWVRQNNQPLNLKWFGAACDATGIGVGTDDTTAIEAWLAMLKFTLFDGYVPGPSRYNPSTGIWDLTGANHGMRMYGASVNNSGFWLDTGKQIKIQGANNFYQQFVNFKVIGNVSGPVLTIGKDDFSDAFNGLDVQLTVNNNSVNSAAEGLRLNYVLASRVFATVNCGGTGRLGAGQGSALVLRQACFNTFQVACGQALNALYITNGFNFGNTFLANDYEEVGTAVQIDTANAARNVWTGGTFAALTIFNCTAGASNIFIGTNLSPYGGGTLGANRTGVIYDDGVSRSVAQKISPPTAAPSAALFTLDSPATAYRSQLSYTRAGVAKYDHFMNGDATGDIYEYVTDDSAVARQVSQTVRASGAKIFNQGLTCNSATAGLGYSTGAGGTVTQATSKSTGVTLNKVSGQITMNNAALASATIVSFVLTNSAIAATDVLVLNHISGGTVGSYTLNAQCAAGSATINVRNNTAGSLGEAIVIQFALIKGVNA